MPEKRIKNVNRLLRRFIRELEKTIRVEKVFVYGSYARRQAHDYSDLDVAVVSADFEGGTERDYLILGRAALKVSPLIEAKPYRPKDLANLSPVDFLAEILRTGKKVYDRAA